MTRAKRVRDFLATQTQPLSSGEICAGIGEPGSIKAMHTIGTMYKGGFLTRVATKGNAFLYVLARTDFVSRPRGLTRDEKLARRRQNSINRDRAKGVKSWDEHVAELAKRRVAKGVKVMTTENAARDKRDAARQIVAMRSNALAAAPVAEDRPCTESWLAENRHDPAKYEVLRPGQWTVPLRFEY